MSSSSFSIFLSILICFLFCFTNGQQQNFQGWTPQQIEAYRSHYYNWYHQQRVAPQPVVTQAPVELHNHPIFRNFEKDDKGNVWHGNDDAKILFISRSSYP
ncbi:unnamed protein product [Caenorhabditis angaria]|uniref:Uncharacterized protein n=1 Tax=Caenorhabditis angaria TaxID=860376 RepID=A0A9P1IAD6_9PELO|nr:unnamed protein product [Caenorhabditis angaria]